MDSQSTRRFRAPLLAGALLFLGTGCVTQARYDESLEQVAYYQRALQDLEVFHGACEAKITRLEGELAIRAGEPIEAGMTAEIDQRLAELGTIVEGIGAPGSVGLLPVEGGYGLRLSNAVLFSSGSHEVTEEGRSILADTAQEISGRPFARVWVRGHTDSDPIVREATLQRYPNGNLDLSVSRAIQVATILSENGIPLNKLVVAGFGPSDPLAGNTSAEEKAQNRRVEIFVIEDADSADGEG